MESIESITENVNLGSTRAKRVSPLRAIRGKCLDCCCGNEKFVRECTITSCNLWPFRMGRNPNRKGFGGHGLPFQTKKRPQPDDAGRGIEVG